MLKNCHSHGGNLWAAAASAGLDPSQVIDFSANINPMGPPEKVLHLLQGQLEIIRHYPEPYGGRFRQDLAVYHGVPPEEVLVGNGAAEIIYLLARALAPERTLIPIPTFSEYARAAAAAGSRVDYFRLEPNMDFRVPVREFSRVIRQGNYDLVFLCNPNNPTGSWMGPEEMAELVGVAEAAGTWLAIDESFAEFLVGPGETGRTGGGEANRTGSSKANRTGGSKVIRTGNEERPARLFTIRSLTKHFALPGLRLGYGLGPAELVSAIERLRDPWSVNTLAQLAGRACLAEKAYLQETRGLIAGAREELSAGLRTLPGIRIYPSEVNFILLDIRRAGKTSGQLWQEMLRRGILIRDCSNFPGLDEYHVRVAVRKSEENLQLVHYLSDIVGLV